MTALASVPEARQCGQRHGYTLILRQELRSDDEGRYVVTTATGSQYEFDLSARTVKRQMGHTARAYGASTWQMSVILPGPVIPPFGYAGPNCVHVT